MHCLLLALMSMFMSMFMNTDHAPSIDSSFAHHIRVINVEVRMHITKIPEMLRVQTADWVWDRARESEDLHKHKARQKHHTFIRENPLRCPSRVLLAGSSLDIKHNLLKQTLNFSAVLQKLTAFYTKAINFAFNGRTAGTSATTGSTCPRYMIWQAACMYEILYFIYYTIVNYIAKYFRQSVQSIIYSRRKRT